MELAVRENKINDGGNPTMRISLVTVTYNRADLLFRGLRTVINQEVVPDEIVIVDDGSSDNTKDKIDELKLMATKKKIDWTYVYLNHPEPRISCIPRNVGIKKSTGDVIIFTEPEALHVGNTIEQLLTKYQENPGSVILASQIWSMGRRIQEKLDDENFIYPARIISHQYAMLVDGNMQNTNAPDSDFGITGELNCNAGVLFMVSRRGLDRVRGFDESFEGHGFDDFDLFKRLGDAGYPLIKCSDIIAIHQYHDKSFYPYNTIDAGVKNGKISEAREGYEANIGKDWGLG